MTPRKASILVVDDDVRILRMMRRILELEGYHALTASNGEAALDVLDEQSPDMMLLDIRMPGMDGYTVCRRIREFSHMPIIIVTVKDNDAEKIEGLDAGADDYVTKPFSAKELAARVRAVLRRTESWGDHPQPAFQCDGLVVDFAHHRVTLNGQEANLTATEYRLLSYLAHNAGRVVTPDQILERVWGEGYIGEHHLLRVSIARLRQKLRDDPKKPRFIVTRIGIGYMLLSPN